MINRWNEVARFALMHSMATSLFFWFWSVRNETVDSLQHQHLLRDHQQPISSRQDAVMMPYLMNSVEDSGGKYILSAGRFLTRTRTKVFS